MPPNSADNREETKPPCERRHAEWMLHDRRWRFLLDSWEGGEAYRQAIYGFDPRGEPIRNLVRHKREYGDPRDHAAYSVLGRPDGTDQAAIATDSDYELRRARTPVPTMLRDALERHLAAIYSQEVKRHADAIITDWWEDVDGRGTSIDDFMADTAAPLLMLFGGLDLLFDHPRAADPDAIVTRADQIAAGLDRCVVSIILPTNMVWWDLDIFGGYLECVVAEVDEDGCSNYRHWTGDDSTLYDSDGRIVEPPTPHPFGRVPIVRIFDRKRPRSENVGFPRYEPLAELQREYYNRGSELILSDTMQSCPLLQGPEDYVQADGTLPIGPSWLLPAKKYQSAGGGYAYEGFTYVDPPKGAAESIRANMADLIDQADRNSLLTKPAGSNGTDGNSVGQSGVSKRLDANEANKLLSRVAKVLDKAETSIAAFARMVLTDGQIDADDKDGIKVSYPTNFDLFSPEEMAMIAAEFQAILAGVGHAPISEAEILKKLARMILMGLDDDQYAHIDAELDAYCQAAGKRQQQALESPLTAPGMTPPGGPIPAQVPVAKPAEVPVARHAMPPKPSEV